MTTSLAEILHNIADHTETILHILNDPGVPLDVSQRMFSHILLEEKENTTKLEAVRGEGPTLLTQKMLDHSFFIQRMLQEQAMSTDLKKELLDHFMEEHQEWRVELLGPDAPAHGAAGQKVAGGLQPASTHGGGSNASVSYPSTSHSGAPSHGGHSGGGKPSHGGHGGHGSGGAHGGHSGHGGQSSHSSGSGSSQQPKPSYGPGYSGQTRSKPREENSGTAGATKGNWTVGPLWPQGG